MRLFGSVRHGTDRADSDVDLLVHFEPGTQIGLLGMAELELELSALIGRRVDLRTEPELSRYFRDAVVQGAEVLYAAA